ncbi:MAG: RNA-protein complex protein Nop10 [Infirmifilum sp.]|uniref:RNA-protein complex protein Nop10 n=1 Tax=Infirmifilum TaxID=2856573 RepID=UPI00214EAC68|nr:RNA-protein complex protein Nop10 [Infirmifilum uzonense]
MGKHTLLHKCSQCGMYTLRSDKCPYCGGELRAAHPAKFSPEDPYGDYRRKMKLEILLDKRN